MDTILCYIPFTSVRGHDRILYIVLGHPVERTFLAYNRRVYIYIYIYARHLRVYIYI